jgi:hypothetical protein
MIHYKVICRNKAPVNSEGIFIYRIESMYMCHNNYDREQNSRRDRTDDARHAGDEDTQNLRTE